MAPQFVLSEEEFTGIEDCLAQVQMVRNLTAVVEANPRLDAPVTRTQLVAFLGSIEGCLARAIDACNERQAAESAMRRGEAERIVDAAVSEGRLSADRRESAVNIGAASIERLVAWLNGEHVMGLAPLPAIDPPGGEQSVDVAELIAVYGRLAEVARAVEAAQLSGRLPRDRTSDALAIGYRGLPALEAWLNRRQVEGFAPLARIAKTRRERAADRLAS